MRKRNYLRFIALIIIVFTLQITCIANKIALTSSSYLKVIPSSKTELDTGILKVTAQITDLDNNEINSSDIALNSEFLIKIKNIGTVNCNYKVTNEGTESNDFSQNIIVYITNMKTSSSASADYSFLNSMSLLSRSLIFQNKVLKPGETDTFKIKLSTARLDNETWKATHTVTSTDALIKFIVYTITSS